ncbi:MAG: hypothetical protein FWH10_01585 [Oscillospiraceae bacterium]|nr:hypothetical protein [Oscillospiraceae bacterium]
MNNYTAPEKTQEHRQSQDVNLQSENQKVETLFDLINKKANIKFFKSQNAEYCIMVNAIDLGIYGIYVIQSKQFKSLIRSLLYKSSNIILNEKDCKEITEQYYALADIESEYCYLNNRIAYKDRSIFYDLCNRKNEVIVISDNVITTLNKGNTSILLEVNENMCEQVQPNLEAKPDKYLEMLKRHFKLKNDDLFLLAVYIIACFIQHIPHPVLNLYGTQGSSKSTTALKIQSIVAPVQADLIPLTKVDLTATLSNTYMTIFDNVSKISEEISDTLCTVVYGGKVKKRKNYTDNDKKIIEIKSCVIITSINIAITKADLLDRSILIGLDQLNGKERKTEESIKEDFNRDLPEIIGSIFQILRQVLKYDFDKLPDFELPRMADFAKYGYAIGEILETNGGKRFLEIYGNNINVAEDEILMENPICDVIKRFVYENPEWIGTMTQLYRELNSFLKSKNEKITKYPNSPSALSRQINELTTALNRSGISIEKPFGGKGERFTKFCYHHSKDLTNIEEE